MSIFCPISGALSTSTDQQSLPLAQKRRLYWLELFKFKAKPLIFFVTFVAFNMQRLLWLFAALRRWHYWEKSNF